jgi:hypothetical protein
MCKKINKQKQCKQKQQSASRFYIVLRPCTQKPHAYTSSALGLTGSKLVLTYVKKALGGYLYTPCRHLIELTVGIPLLARGSRGLYEQKLSKYRILVAVCAIWAQLPRRQVAYGYMACRAMCNLGSIFLVA